MYKMSFLQNETVGKVTAIFLLPYILIPQKLQLVPRPTHGLLLCSSTSGLFLSITILMLRGKSESISVSYGITLET